VALALQARGDHARTDVHRAAQGNLLKGPFDGVKAASGYLRSIGATRKERIEILRSFEIDTIKLRQAGSSEFGLRYFDNVNAFPKGRYLFETFPASRTSAAIKPQWNQMRGIAQWRIVPGTPIIEGRAAAQGLELARLRTSIDLVCIDGVLPDLLTRRALDAICALQPRAAVLAFSGHLDEEALRARVAEGRHTLLAKPFGAAALLDAAAALLT
jgi:CheY-like chemotaxis protein